MMTDTLGQNAEPSWDEEAEVVVIGGGLAGHCAALELAAQGVEALLLEKQPEIGGSTVLSGGSFAFAGTELQRSNGIEDSVAMLFDDLRRVGGFGNEERLVRVYVDNQLDTYHWLAEHGVVFEKVFLAAGHSVPRAHSRNPRVVLETLAAAAQASGRVSTRTRAAVRRLVRTSSDGPVEGVVVDVEGRQRAIRALRGVILASGGFSRNDDLLKLFAPTQAGAMRAGGPGNVGDGLRMAWRLGAGMRDMGYIKGTFGGYPGAKPGEHALMLPIYVGAIAVNAQGERFIDESKSYKLIGDAVLQQPDATGFQIFDQRIFERGQPDIPTMAFQAKFALGQVVSAPTLRELAARLGIDEAGLTKTVDAYNAYVEAGSDRTFGRSALSNGYGKLERIDAPPFYGYPSKSVIVATYCGVAVDPGMRVCDVYDTPIAGLYAAGEVVGGLHGNAYMTGSSLGKAAIFGRLAARGALGVARERAGASA
ncbi:FAD-dependent oxidoreductase [Caballeronia sp. LjRoot31]|uniref:FAD-dependent oxidoreductase n=1 Tax=Caballeronia sp. LjRoot31 TaxID=3342324 RepID=UPI003ED0BDF0